MREAEQKHVSVPVRKEKKKHYNRHHSFPCKTLQLFSRKSANRHNVMSHPRLRSV